MTKTISISRAVRKAVATIITAMKALCIHCKLVKSTDILIFCFDQNI